jgi:hypothetical protein
MGKINYDPEISNVMDSILLMIPIVEKGKMFGFPAYYVNKKMFACVYEEGVGVKLPIETVNQLIGKEGIIPFIPMGRRQMKEWLQINREQPEDYLKDKEIFETSIRYVASLG